jgi:transposase-like protein
MSAHSVPFYCPYCGEEDLVPTPVDEPAGDDPAGSGGSGHGRWNCRACTRTFQLRLARPGGISAPPERAGSTT